MCSVAELWLFWTQAVFLLPPDYVLRYWRLFRERWWVFSFPFPFFLCLLLFLLPLLFLFILLLILLFSFLFFSFLFFSFLFFSFLFFSFLFFSFLFFSFLFFSFPSSFWTAKYFTTLSGRLKYRNTCVIYFQLKGIIVINSVVYVSSSPSSLLMSTDIWFLHFFLGLKSLSVAVALKVIYSL